MFSTVSKNIIFPQWCAGIGGLLLVLQLGFVGGWTSPTLARLIDNDSPIPISDEQVSWLVSLVNIGRFFGAIIGPLAINCIGSKRSIVATGVPYALSWLTTALAKNVEILYFARITNGVGMGMMYSVYSIYLAEVSVPKMRGALISFASIGSPLGMLIASIASSYLDLLASSSIYFACALVLITIFLWLPESPHHLIKVKNRASAEKSINWYRGGIEVEKELEAVEAFVNSSGNISFMSSFQEFKKPAIKRAMTHIFCLFALQQVSGLNGILFYMETILVRAKFTLFHPSLVLIYANVGCLCSSILSMFLIDRCGRKFLLVLSSVFVTLSCLGLTIYFLLLDRNVNMEQYQWIPVISMIMYMTFYTIGLLSVPNTLLSEIFPANIKFIASFIAILTGAVLAFLTSKTYQPLVDIMGEAYVFLIYAIFTVVVIPYTLFLVPETKGKSLQQIQNELAAA